MTPAVPGALPDWLRVSAGPAPEGAIMIDGRACRDRAGLFTEFATVLDFPGYFGRNWDAFADCLRDAADDRDLLLYVTHSAELLADEPLRLGTLLEIMGETRPEIAVVLHTPAAGRTALRARIAEALSLR